MFRSPAARLRPFAVFDRLSWLAARLRYHWLGWKQDNLLFTAALAVPLVVFAVFGRFAYVDQQQRAAARQRIVDLTCLAENIFHEARGEPLAGQRAVAEVTLNRVASDRYPDSVCAVVREKRWDPRRERYVGAFSWTELDRLATPQGVAWQRAAAAAQAVYDREHEPQVGGALHYHATRILPRWAEGRTPLVTIGRHAFYE